MQTIKILLNQYTYGQIFRWNDTQKWIQCEYNIIMLIMWFLPAVFWLHNVYGGRFWSVNMVSLESVIASHRIVSIMRFFLLFIVCLPEMLAFVSFCNVANISCVKWTNMTFWACNKQFFFHIQASESILIKFDRQPEIGIVFQLG